STSSRRRRAFRNRSRAARTAGLRALQACERASRAAAGIGRTSITALHAWRREGSGWPRKKSFDSQAINVFCRSMARYIFITGGVVSSLGKGLASAALGALLQARGYSVRLRKLDPYLNVDPGTMSPYQHGEVFVTDDGAETDLDLGHYERFT